MQNSDKKKKNGEKNIKNIEDEKKREKVLTKEGECDRINYVATGEVVKGTLKTKQYERQAKRPLRDSEE